jgi:hypothetical protein
MRKMTTKKSKASSVQPKKAALHACHCSVLRKGSGAREALTVISAQNGR